MKSIRTAGLSSIVVLLVAISTSAHALPSKQSNAGDSISQGFDANDHPWDQTQESWVQGTDPDIDSVYSRYLSLNSSFTQQPESVSGAEMVGGGDNFAAQASRICAQSPVPDHVSVLLGGNDVCNRAASSTSDATANLYSVDTFRNALRAGLDELAACLPAGATVQVLSMPRVDKLKAAGNDKSFTCSWSWSVAHVCRIVTNEGDQGRLDQIGGRVDEYNNGLAADVNDYNLNTTGQNPNGIWFYTDWQGSVNDGFANTSVGTRFFGGSEINIVDCFHPNETGQHELACVAWATNPDGAGTPQGCFQ